MATKLQLLEKKETKLQDELKSLEQDRRNKFSELCAMPTLTESGAIAVNALDMTIKAMQGKIEDARAAVDEEKKRLKSPEVKKARGDLETLEGELRAEQKRLVEMLIAIRDSAYAMQERARTLYKLRRLAGFDYDQNAPFDDRLTAWTAKVIGNLNPLRSIGGMEELPASKKPA